MNSIDKIKRFISTELKTPPEPVFKNEEPTAIVCKCGGENVVLKQIEDGSEYHECKDCGRNWYAY